MVQRTLGVAILGSTGTIGINTLQVLDAYPDRYRVFALSANTDVEGLWRQCCHYRPAYAVMRNTDAAQALYDKIKSAGLTTEVLFGAEGLEWVASHSHVDYVMAAIVGAAGLLPTLAAAKAGKRILLANKEALVMSGNILMDTIKKYGATLLPIDSEHNAIFQCLPSDYAERGMHGAHVVSIMLTASGGPFRTTPLDALPQVSPQMACVHPNWQMGRKISVDSATMMNKGLEVIEACWLFGIPADMIQVVIHPQSIVHSMVAYADGSVLAQLGSPDMRTPIAHGLAWPQRIHAGVEPLDIFKVAQLDFHKPDLERFPCLNLAYQAIKQGGTATAILNAANEIAVAAFLDERINFVQIATVIEQTLSDIPARPVTDLDIVLATDANARLHAEDKVKKLSSRSCRY